MPKRTLRIGVIGTDLGRTMHIPGLQMLPQVEVAAVCAGAAEDAHATALRHHVPLYFDDYRTMIHNAELDAIVITGPPANRHPAAIAAAESGLHILCEKPMARNAAEARDMLRLVKEVGIRHAVNFRSRFTAARARIKALVEQGYLGELQSVSITVYRPPLAERQIQPSGLSDDCERAAGALQAIGSDYVDTLRWWFGEIHTVAGITTANLHTGKSGHPDSANFAIILEFANGATGSIHVSATSPVNLGEEIVAIGSDGMLALQADGRLFGTKRSEQEITELPIENVAGGILGTAHPRLRPFLLLASDWVAGILTGVAGIAPSFEDGMKVQEVVDAVERSRHLSRWIDTSGKRWPVQ
ncbi:Gfo/Idh/MocA family protein [Nitrolancea hollandica]|uniref:Oxidoreductase domain protein n=1 Tax=Nitrolancea hollandica Lb TaxID=1129897 RepID=I4EKY0_9BACT|nr:Gfo/Idh/MocA family oxidoreductase [Nitrolancea hollandica]CCF85342.1 Oxidoreductase domain protein [Nitrolancea hollandica Lb]